MPSPASKLERSTNSCQAPWKLFWIPQSHLHHPIVLTITYVTEPGLYIYKRGTVTINTTWSHVSESGFAVTRKQHNLVSRSRRTEGINQ